MKHFCKICNALIHPKRVELGYKDTCVKHSQSSRYSGFMTSDGKDTRGIQIIKDPKVAERLHMLDKTKGRVSHKA